MILIFYPGKYYLLLDPEDLSSKGFRELDDGSVLQETVRIFVLQFIIYIDLLDIVRINQGYRRRTGVWCGQTKHVLVCV